MNSVNISGRLGQQPELKRSAGGTNFVTGTIAVRERRGGTDKTNWFKYKAFKGTADLIANYCSKGDNVGFTGRLDTSEWTDQSGNNRTTVEILVNEVTFMESSNRPQTQPQQPHWDSNVSQNGGWQTVKTNAGWGQNRQDTFTGGFNAQAESPTIEVDDGDLPF
jgi:single-strand DNA-binding protein